MKKAMLVMLVFGALGAVATAGGFSVSFGYSDCGRSYYRPSYYGSYYRPSYYRSYYRPSYYGSYYRPSYRSHHHYRSYGHCYRPSVVYVPRIRYCR